MRRMTAAVVLALSLAAAAAHAQTDAKSRNTTKITSGNAYSEDGKPFRGLRSH